MFLVGIALVTIRPANFGGCLRRTDEELPLCNVLNALEVRYNHWKTLVLDFDRKMWGLLVDSDMQ
jgi:hypothetical protein